LHAPQHHQRGIALAQTQPHTGAQENDKIADIRDPAAVDVGHGAPEAGRQVLENEVRGDCQVDCGDGDVQVRSDGGEGGELDVRCEARDCDWGCETRLRAQLVGWGLQVAAVEARKTTRAFWRGEKMPYGSSERRVWFGCAGWLEGDMGCSEVFGVIGEAVKS
jgi:hypothetical protein